MLIFFLLPKLTVNHKYFGWIQLKVVHNRSTITVKMRSSLFLAVKSQEKPLVLRRTIFHRPLFLHVVRKITRQGKNVNKATNIEVTFLFKPFQEVYWNKGYHWVKVCRKKARERINGITVIITISVLKCKSKGYRSMLYCTLLSVRWFNISFHGKKSITVNFIIILESIDMTKMYRAI